MSPCHPLTLISCMQVGAYFNKIQCFCFEEQQLGPGEEIDMPVFFYIDKDILKDPAVKGVDTITLSYTFFKTDEFDAQQADVPLPAHAQKQQ